MGICYQPEGEGEGKQEGEEEGVWRGSRPEIALLTLRERRGGCQLRGREGGRHVSTAPLTLMVVPQNLDIIYF